MERDLLLGVDHLSFIPGPRPPQIVSGEGSWLVTADGRRILDGAGGAIVTNIGHGRRDVAEIAARSAGEVDYVIPPWATASRIALRDRLVRSWLPDGLTQVAFCGGGSEAAETAIRVARAYQLSIGQSERWKVIGRWPSYHGATIATLAMGGHQARRSGFAPLFPDFPHVPWDDADALDAMIEAQGPETIAAFVAEPVIGAAGGALVPSDSYFEAVAETCRRHGVLFIADEVMSGFGRTGRNFGIDHWSVTPDILYGGKGMAGGYAAINGTYATRAVVEPIAAAGQSLMFFTFGGQSSHCAVADAVLSIMEDENLVERAAKMGGVLKDRLHAEFSDHPNVADIRGLGLFLGLEFVQTREPHAWFPPATGFAARVVGEALQRDLWVYPAGSGNAVQDAILVGPPFTITEDEIEQLVTRLRSAVDAAAKSVSYLP